MWRRSSWKLLAIRFAEGVRVYVPFVFFHSMLTDSIPEWGTTAWRVLFWLVTLDRVHTLFYEWAATRFRFDDHGVSVDKGLLNRKIVSFDWADVSSVQVEQNALERTLGCATLTVGVGAHDKQHVALAGIDRGDADHIAQLHEQARGAVESDGPAPSGSHSEMDTGDSVEPPPPTPPAAADGPDDRRDGRLIYRITPMDYLLISLTYGQFLLLLPFGLSVFSELSDLGAADVLRQWVGDLLVASPPWATAVFGSIAAVMAALAYGYTVTWLKFSRFEVRERAAVFGIQGGAFARGRHQISTADVQGIRLKRNPVMQALGYAQMILMSRDSVGTSRMQKVVPVGRVGYVEELVLAYFPQFSAVSTRSRAPRGARVLLIALTLASLAVSGAVGRLLVDGRGYGLLLVAVSLLHVGVLNARWTTFDVDSDAGTLFFRRGLIWRSEYRVPLRGVHSTVSARNPVSHRFGWHTLTVYVFSGTAIHMRAPVAGTHIDEVLAVLMDQPEVADGKPVRVAAEAMPLM